MYSSVNFDSLAIRIAEIHHSRLIMIKVITKMLKKGKEKRNRRCGLKIQNPPLGSLKWSLPANSEIAVDKVK